MERANYAVDCLTTQAIVDFKAHGANRPETHAVTNALLILVCGERNKQKLTWENAQKMMNQPQRFLEQLYSFDKDGITAQTVEELEPILSLDYFKPDIMMKPG